MLTGAPPRAHGMSSNFVPSLGVKCESIFDTLRASGATGRMVGIAHLVDAFGEDDVETVTAVTDNDEIDEALAARARDPCIERDDPGSAWCCSSSASTRRATRGAATTTNTLSQDRGHRPDNRQVFRVV